MPTITGYVTKTNGKLEKQGFEMMIIDDNIEKKKGNRPKLPEKAMITISSSLYPHGTADRFVEAEEGWRLDSIKRCMSISEGLKEGDRVECHVYSVEVDLDTNGTNYKIKDDNKIKSYADSNLWLNPIGDSFHRLDVDTPQSLKFRKQNYFTEINRNRCERIAGSSSYRYKYKWWINKNPNLLCPLFAWIRFRIKVSDLWSKLTEQDNLNKILIFVTIISVVLNIIQAYFSLKKD